MRIRIAISCKFREGVLTKIKILGSSKRPGRSECGSRGYLLERGPLPRRGFLSSRRKLPGAGPSDRLRPVPLDRSDFRVPKMGVPQRRNRGNTIGRFDVTTATNVSRHAHEPAC